MGGSTANESILVFTTIERDASLVCQIGEQAGFRFKRCHTVEDVAAGIREGAGAAIIGQEALRRESVALLEAVIADQPNWSDFPVIIVAVPGASGVTEVLRATAGLGNVVFLERPFSIAGFVTTVRAALRARRRQYEIQQSQIDADRTRAQLEAVFQAMQDGVAVLNMQGDVILVNEAAARISGFPSAGEMRRSFTSFAALFEFTTLEGFSLPAEQWPAVRVLRGEAFTDWELRRRRRDTQQELVLSFSGQPVYDHAGRQVLGVVAIRDITSRERAEDALRESEERMSLAITATELGTFDFYPQTGTLIWSALTRRHFGVSSEAEVTYDTFLRGLHSDDRDRVDSTVKSVLQPGSVGHYAVEFRTVGLDDAQERWISSQGQVFYGADGRAIRFVGVTLDISERRRIEQQLRHAQKLESIGVLASGVAHDFNNLLTSVLGNASLAQSEAPAHLMPTLDGIIEAAHRAAGLTRQLLAYAGKGQFEIGDVTIYRVVQSSTELIRVSTPKNITLIVEVPHGLPSIRGDAAQIQQVIMNLVINAAEAIEPGQNGTVAVRAKVENIAVNPGVPGFDIAPGQYVRLEVSDNGCGMDEAVAAKIFDPFFTTKFTGRGLGLAAVQGIVRSHKGAIAVQSRPGEGTTFSVYLPCATTAAVPRPLKPIHAAAPHTARILVVDDEFAIRKLAKAALKRLGHTVLEAENGRQALEVLRTAAPVDLVLLDVVMPVIGGGEALREIREHWPDTGVLVSSGFNCEEANRLGSIPAGLSFLEKPYTVQKLTEAVAEVLSRARAPHIRHASE